MRMKRLVILLSMPALITACGGGGAGGSGGGGSVVPGSSINAQFIDAPVKGMQLETVAGTAQTGANGSFTCLLGEEVTFKLKDLEIGKANCGEKVFLYDLTSTDDQKDAAAALIQSFAHYSGGILDLSTFNSSGVSLVGTALNTGTIAADIGTVFTNNASLGTAGLAAVTVADARTHALSNLPDQSTDAVLIALADQESTLDLVPASSNDTEQCWANIQIKVEVESIDAGSGKKAFRFKVNEYLAYETETPPASPTCDGEEYGDDSTAYQCFTNPVSRIMNGRSITGAHFEKYSLNLVQGETAACFDTGNDMYYVNEDTLGGVCQMGETEIEMSKSQTLNLDYGWSYKLQVTDTNFTVNFTEDAINVEPTITNMETPASAAISFTADKFKCNYSLTDSF